MEFSEKLSYLRKKAGLSQEQLADRLGVTRQSVSKWESGAAMPELVKLIALSELFGVSVDYLVKDHMAEQEQASGNSSDTARLEQKLDALSRQVDADEEKMLEQLAVIVQQLTENAASSSTQLTQYQQNLQTEMETGKSDLTETAMQKYKVLLGVSLSFGIVNFLGVVALLIINLMP